MLAHSSQNTPKAPSPCCRSRPMSGASPRVFCGKVLGGSVFCELWKDFRWQGCWLSAGEDAAGTQKTSSGGKTTWPVACVFAGVSLLLGTGLFPKVQMRGASHFYETLLRGAHLEQVLPLGQLSHAAQWELDQSLSSLWEKKWFCLESIYQWTKQVLLGQMLPFFPVAEHVPMPIAC